MIISTKNDKVLKYLDSNNIAYNKIYDDNTYFVESNINLDSFDDVKIFNSLYTLSTRDFKKENTIIKLNKDTIFGNNSLVFIAGPCAIESYDSLYDIAKNALLIGANIIRGGTFKIRTSPYTFQGLGKDAFPIIDKVKDKTNCLFVSEITSIEELPYFLKSVDIIQVGTRNMQNFELLKELGKINKPILLKRGMANTIEELLMAADYILKEGNHNVILCERGIRTFENLTRNTLDLSAVSLLKKISHLPVIVDPSHATGNKDLVKDMSLAAIACGADGLIIEVHNDINNCKSDKDQAIDYKTFKEIVNKSRKIKEIINER